MTSERTLDEAGAAAAATRAPARSALPVGWLADRVVLFRLGEVIFVSYGLAAAAGALLTMAWLSVLLSGQGVSTGQIVLLGVGGSVGAVVGSRLAALALDWRLLMRRPVEALRSASFVSWGGILVLVLAPMLFSLASGHALLPLLDAIVRSGPLGHAIGRLGCLAYGCCYGRPTGLPLSVTYRNPEAKAARTGGLRGVPLQPTALYEAILNIGVFVLLNALAFLGAPQGVPATVYLLAYGSGRFLIEFSRDNSGRELWGGISVNHVIAGGLAACGAIFLPVVLVFRAGAPAIAYGQGLEDALRILPLLALCSLILFVGFSLQRSRVGRW